MTTVAIIQARMSSTRLPRKVLADVAGKPLITRVIDRVCAARCIDSVVVATTTDPEDEELADFLDGDPRCSVYRGMRDDVLDRFFRCAQRYQAERVVRITADDPLKDPSIMDRAVRILLNDPALDYCSNTLEPTYPEGLDVEVFTLEALRRAHAEASLPSEREHVTPYIWKHPELFKIATFSYERNLSAWRWTVDKVSDLEFIRAVFGHFGGDSLVSFVDVIAWLEGNPQIVAINEGTMRNEGYLVSLEHEKSE